MVNELWRVIRIKYNIAIKIMDDDCVKIKRNVHEIFNLKIKNKAVQTLSLQL